MCTQIHKLWMPVSGKNICKSANHRATNCKIIINFDKSVLNKSLITKYSRQPKRQNTQGWF